MCSAPKPKTPAPVKPADPPVLETESTKKRRKRAEPEASGRRSLRIDLNFNPGQSSGLRIPTSS